MNTSQDEEINLGQHLPRSDGDGGLLMSKPFALITVIITLIVIIGQSVFVFAQLDGRVGLLEEKTANSREVWERLYECETQTMLLDQKLGVLIENSIEIKQDVKELRVEITTHYLSRD